MLPLRGARVDETDSSTFSVIVAGKEGIFSCATQKENEEWGEGREGAKPQSRYYHNHSKVIPKSYYSTILVM